jgi:hypothetical protein
MTPEDRLDALLTTRRAIEGERRRERAEGDWRQERAEVNVAGDDELLPLLESADFLAPLRTLRPDHPFAHALESEMLARASARRRARLNAATWPRPLQSAVPRSRLWLPAIGRSALRPSVVAAAALLALCVGMLTVATAAAGPGDPLFGLHRYWQGIGVAVAGDSSERAHGHLDLAHEWLASVHDAAVQHRGDPTYSDALQALQQEDAAAAQEIAQMPTGTARTSLEADLATLHADEITTLQAALAPLGWQDRIITTDALGALGVKVPRVNGATIDLNDATDAARWPVTLTGSGFAPGAVLLVNGQPAGIVTGVSVGGLSGELLLGENAPVPAALGVGNADGTAAITRSIQVLRPISPAGTASPGAATPITAAAPTATASSIPSASPTATPLPQLEGKIVSTSPATNSFMLARGSGSPIQIDVNSNTHFEGAASSLSTLGSGGYWTAEVRGVYESNGNFLAYSVDSCSRQYGC